MLASQTFPYPDELSDAVGELRYLPGWFFTLTNEERGQDCSGLTLSVYPNKRDSYHPESHVNTVFTYPVPAASFNRESWEEWLWGRIEDTERHERSEWFRFGGFGQHEFVGAMPLCQECAAGRSDPIHKPLRRPFKPAHADGWDPSVARTVVSETVTNTPNAGRMVQVPCGVCEHRHSGRMGEHFTIESVNACWEPGCKCLWRVNT